MWACPSRFRQYDSFTTRAALSECPNFRWFRAEGRSSGQIHDSEEDGNIFVCIDCGNMACLVHEGAHDVDETCEESKYRTSGQQEHNEKKKKQEEASVTAIGRIMKGCPETECASPIQKNGGCMHMTCKFYVVEVKDVC